GAHAAGPDHGVASLRVRIVTSEVDIENNHEPHSARSGSQHGCLCQPGRLLSDGCVLRPGKAARQRAVACWRQVAKFGEAAFLAAEWAKRPAEHRREVTRRVIPTGIATALIRADDALIIVDADAIGIAPGTGSGHACIVLIIVPDSVSPES